MNIAIVSTGYIGFSDEKFLAQYDEVVALKKITGNIQMLKKMLSMGEAEFESIYSDVNTLMAVFDYESIIKGFNSFISCHNKFEVNHAWNSVYD